MLIELRVNVNPRVLFARCSRHRSMRLFVFLAQPPDACRTDFVHSPRASRKLCLGKINCASR